MTSFIYDHRWGIKAGTKNLYPIVKCVLITPWCPTNRLEWYTEIISSAHVSGIANNAVSFLDVVTSFSTNKSNKMYLSAKVSFFLVATLVLGNLFCVWYKYMSVKYGLVLYPACISFTVTSKWIAFRTFSFYYSNNLSISASLVKTFCTNLPVLTQLCSSDGS